MINAVACVLVAALSVVIARVMREYRRRRLAICEELYALILHIKLQVGCYLRPVNELLRDYASPLLEELGVLSLARSEGLVKALEDGALPLTGEERRILAALFSSLGSGYMADEIRLIDSYGGEFYKLLSAHRAQMPRDIKLINTLCASGALGIVILMI